MSALNARSAPNSVRQRGAGRGTIACCFCCALVLLRFVLVRRHGAADSFTKPASHDETAAVRGCATFARCFSDPVFFRRHHHFLSLIGSWCLGTWW